MPRKKAATGETDKDERLARSLPELSEGWMRPHEICTRQGTCNVLIMVPHGFPADSDNTEILGYRLAEKSDASAVINNRKFMRGKNQTRTPGFVGDLYDVQLFSVYRSSIADFVEQTRRHFDKPPVVLFLCGIDDKATLETVSKHCGASDAAFLLRAGYVVDYQSVPLPLPEAYMVAYDENRATAGIPFIKQFLFRLRDTLGPGGDGVPLYGVEDEVLRAIRSEFGPDIEAVRMDIAFHGFRDNAENVEKTAKILAEAIRGLDAVESLPVQPGGVAALEIIPEAPQEVVAVDGELVDQAVQFINEKMQETVYRGSEEIGAYLLEKFFDNDIRKAASRNSKKAMSFRRLCAREDLLVHPATLSVMVRVAAQENFFRDKGLDSGRLSFRHKAELVKLPNDDQKVAAAQKAMDEKMSARFLAQHVSGMRPTKTMPVEGLERILERFVADPLRLFSSAEQTKSLLDMDTLRKVPRDERQKLHAEAFNMIEKTKEWMNQYKELVRRLDRIEAKEKKDQRDTGTE
jgi:hypothetical protein